MAVAYLPALRDQQHIFLLEVVGGGESINTERDLFEATYEATPEFPMGPKEQFHLILTNPTELETALRDGWRLAVELVNAIRAGNYKAIHKDKTGKRVLAILESEARRQEAVRG
ncbi:MAG: hypothetical protein L0Y72_12310 [Gemmataceae bacterium]|nr:hypothetical protein [Gemmataceae bacterium]MCI0739821.1 hypothetical protein [Gemmataceae bacterium]